MKRNDELHHEVRWNIMTYRRSPKQRRRTFVFSAEVMGQLSDDQLGRAQLPSFSWCHSRITEISVSAEGETKGAALTALTQRIGTGTRFKLAYSTWRRRHALHRNTRSGMTSSWSQRLVFLRVDTYVNVSSDSFLAIMLRVRSIRS
jgi:hypothetical protein